VLISEDFRLSTVDKKNFSNTSWDIPDTWKLNDGEAARMVMIVNAGFPPVKTGLPVWHIADGTARPRSSSRWGPTRSAA